MDPVPIILVVDDNLGDILLIKEIYGSCAVSIEIHQAINAVQAFEYLGELKKNEVSRKPDFIILDLNMPIFNGVHVLTFVKKTEVLKNIPVIVFTSSASADDRHICLSLGAREYISKPLELEKLRLVMMGLKRKYIGPCQESDCRLA